MKDLVWQRQDHTIYTLMHAGWLKGNETFKNRFAFTVYADRECSPEETEAAVSCIHVAVSNHDALVAALEKLANQLPDCLLEWIAPDVSNSNVSAIRQARDDARAALAAVQSQEGVTR